MVANTVVAKQGYSGMALGACYGAPMLNMLIGLGIAFVWRCINLYPKPVPIKHSATMIIAFICLLVSLCSSFIYVFFAKSTSDEVGNVRPPTIRKWFAYYLFSLYGVFMTLGVLHETGVIFANVK